MFSCYIEFRPYRNHHTSVHGMNGVDHSLRIRETILVEFMTSPGIFRPVIPVEDNIVNRNLTVAETFQCTKHFIRCIILFTALPESHCPFRHDRSFSGKSTVTADYIIHIITGYKIIIKLLGHFTPPRLLALFFRINRTQYTQSRVRNSSIRFPFYFKRNFLSSFQVDSKFITVRIPCRTPAFRNYQFIIYIYFRITGIIKDKLKLTRF